MTSGSAFSCIVSDADVCWMKIVSRPVVISDVREPPLNFLREIVKSLAASGDLKMRGALLHSTVTLLARLRG